MQKAKKLKKHKILFKAIKKKEICIKAKYKTFANFVLIKSNTKPKRVISKEKKDFV